ncbi:MAG: hypothetical protein IJ514_00050 [Clostridia bacterium]|nr:hypothetical protein [Clostridia bacterium]
MILYLAIIAVCSVLIATIASLVFDASFFLLFGYTWLAIVVVMLLDGLTATVCRLLPAKCADHEKKIFQVSAGEKKFYERLKIRKWKDKVPEIGQFTGFRKNKLEDPKSIAYLDRFLLEACYGEIGHFVSLFAGFLILLMFPITEYWWAISVPVAVINALLNLPSFFILRYNSYKLEILRRSNLKKQAREQALAEVAATQK